MFDLHRRCRQRNGELEERCVWLAEVIATWQNHITEAGLGGKLFRDSESVQVLGLWRDMGQELNRCGFGTVGQLRHAALNRDPRLDDLSTETRDFALSAMGALGLLPE
jgi:hypothetical protein